MIWRTPALIRINDSVMFIPLDNKKTNYLPMKIVVGFLFAFALILVKTQVIAQPEFHYMPSQIGWHNAVYYDNKKDPKSGPWTTWKDALEREMNWYLNAP